MPEQGKTMASNDAIFNENFSTLSSDEKKKRFKNLFAYIPDSKCDGPTRAKALNALKKLCENYKPSGSDLESFKKLCEYELKAAMESLINQHNNQWSDIWQFIVPLLGIDIHGIKGLLNSLLAVLEKAMKAKDPETLVLAFNCWATLIDNFALNPEVLAAQRRIDLLTIPLKSKLAKEPDTIIAKFYTWWHLIVQLKKNINRHYVGVLKQFLLFSYGPFSKDLSLITLKLTKRVPKLSSDLLQILAIVLGMGIPEVENRVLACRGNLELPVMPILANTEAFAIVHEEAIYAVADFIICAPEEEFTKLAFEALIHRIAQLRANDETRWQEIMSNLLQLTMAKPNIHTQELGWQHLRQVESILSIWNNQILDTTLKPISKSTREFLLDQILEVKYLLLMPKTVIEKQEERLVRVVRLLLERPGSLVAGPDTMADMNKVVRAIKKAAASTSEPAELVRLLHLWEQLSKVLIKVVPAESANEGCNTLSRKNLLKMMMAPLHLIINFNASKSILNTPAEKLGPCWKAVYIKMVEVSALSLALQRPNCIAEVTEELMKLLHDRHPPVSTVLSLVHIATQLVTVRNSTKTTLDRPELSEVQLLARLAQLLQAVANEDPSKTGRAAKLLAKTLQALMISQPNLRDLVEMFHVFRALLLIPSDFLNKQDEEISDIWKLFAHDFSATLDCSPDKETRETKQLLRELLAPLEELKSHGNIKVQQGAAELEQSFEGCVNKTNQRLSTLLNSKPDENKSSSSKLFNPPLQALVGRKRARKQTLTTLSTPPPTRSKPSLEEQDSQDFVKIAPKEKTKRVLTPHQKESKKRRREDIPALYHGLSQDTYNSQDTQDSCMPDAFPLVSSQPIVLDEDARDTDLRQNQPDNNSPSQAVKPTTPLIMEPTIPHRPAAKETPMEEDVVIIENSNSVTDNLSKKTKKTECTPEKHNETGAGSSEKQVSRPLMRPPKFAVPNLTAGKLSFTTDPVAQSSSKIEKSTQNTKPNNENLAPKSSSENTPINTETNSSTEAEMSQDVRASQNSQPVIQNSKQLACSSVNESVQHKQSSQSSVDEDVIFIAETNSLNFTKRRSTKILAIQSENVSPKSNEPPPSSTEKDTISDTSSSTNQCEDTQDSDIVENSQVTTTLLVKDGMSTTVTSEIVKTVPEVKKTSVKLRLVQNRQGVTLPSRTRLSETSTKEKVWPTRASTGRAAQMLEMAARDSSPSPADKTPVSSSPPVLPSEPPVPSCTETVPTVTAELERNQVEESPEKMEESPAPDNLNSTPKSTGRRSNLKHGNKRDTTPSPRKSKRVSFAEPVVSSERESPKILSEETTFASLYRNGSPKVAKGKSFRVSRKLLMFAAKQHHGNATSTFDQDCRPGTSGLQNSEALTSQGSLPVETPINSQEPIFPSLVSCEASIEQIASRLSSPMLAQSTLQHMRKHDISTVGKLAALSEIIVTSLCIREPKIQTVRQVLQEFAASQPLKEVPVESMDAEPIPLVEEPIPLVEESVPLVEEPIPLVEEPIPLVEEPIPLVEESIPLVEEPIPLVEEPSDEVEIPLADQLAALVSRHSLRTVLVALGCHDEVLAYSMHYSGPANVVRDVITKQAVPDILQMLGRQDEVLEHALSHSQPTKVIAKLVAKTSLPELLQDYEKETCDFVLAKIKPSEIIKKVIKDCSTSEVMESLDRAQEVQEYLLSHAKPLELVKQAGSKESIPAVLQALGRSEEVLQHIVLTSPPQNVLSKICDSAGVAETLLALGHEQEVRDHVLSHCKSVDLLKSLSKVPIPEIVSGMGKQDEILDYVMSCLEPAARVKKAAQNQTTSALLTALGKDAEVLQHVVSNAKAEELMRLAMAQHTTPTLLARIKKSEILDFALSQADPRAVLMNVAAQLSVTEVLKLIGRKDEVLQSVVEDAPLHIMAKAVDMLKQNELKNVVKNLKPEQQQEVCSALPSDCLQKRIWDLMSSGPDKAIITKGIVSKLSNAQIIKELAQRSPDFKIKQVNLEDIKMICAKIPEDVVVELIKIFFDLGKDLKNVRDLMLNHASCDEVTKLLLDKCASKKFSFENLELNQLSELIGLMPLQSIIERMENTLANGQVEDADALKTAILPYFSSTHLLDYLSQLQQNADEETRAVRSALLQLLIKSAPMYAILALVEQRFSSEKLAERSLQALASLSKHLPSQHKLNMMRDAELAELEKFELLEHLVNMLQIKDVMSRLPIKDVINYYETMIEMPESRVPLLRASLVNISEDDMIRFLGAPKILKLIKSQVFAKTPIILSSQVVGVLPVEVVVSAVCDLLTKPDTAEATLGLLKTQFPRDKLCHMLTSIIMSGTSNKN